MSGRGTDTPGGEARRRVVDIAVWCLILVVIVAMAAGITWLLTSSRFQLREVAFEDRAEDLILIAPAPPPPAEPPAPAPAPIVGPNGEVVRRPLWVRQPAPDYPVLAMRRGVESGAVTLLCEAMASGEMGACEVVNEQPAGVGFAEAALAGARDARVKPRSIDGFETDSTIQYTIRFRMASEP